MTHVLVILDGASEPLRREQDHNGNTPITALLPTSLERAHTPTLDALAGEGTLTRLRTVAPHLPPGSESAIPALLGWTPRIRVDRGALEAAAYEIPVAPGHRAWRIDAVTATGAAAGPAETDQAAERLRAGAPDHDVHRLAGHRLLLTGPPPLPVHAKRDDGLSVWPEGAVPPPILDDDTLVIAARGAAAGVARVMGARVTIPPGATGRPGTDLPAKASAAVDAIEAQDAIRLVVHVGSPDEAAHGRDAEAKVREIERADAQVIEPLWRAVRAAGGSLCVCPDHGCDPATGLHDGAPVPSVCWAAERDGHAPADRPAGGASGARRRLTERAVAGLPIEDPAPAATSGAAP